MRTRSSALIGRDDELQAVGRALDAARSGSGGAVFVVGEGGIGKSRLAAAAADLGFGADLCMLRGRGSAIGPMVPYRSLTEALMSLLRSGDPVDVGQLGPYRAVLARLVPDWGAPAPEGGSLLVLAEAVLRLTELAGRERGCLLVLDDLHDSDAESLAVVDYLVDNIGRQRTMLLATVRAEPCPALELARAAAQRAAAVLLEPRRLDRAQVRLLAAALLDCETRQVSDALAQQLWAGSGGVPLLVEELLGAMQRDGLITRAAGGGAGGSGGRQEGDWQVAGGAPAKVAATLTRTVTVRLEKIGGQGRDLLSMAAVLGRRFPLAVLQEAAGLGSWELLSRLHAELAAQFVAPDEEAPDWYAFQHPLVVEALLSLLSAETRTRFARRCAQALETVYPGLPGEWCQVSAALLLQAGDTSGAGRLFAQAGRRAQAQGAATSAVVLLDRALELLVRDEDVQERAEAFAALLPALAEAGLATRAMTSAGELDRFAGLLSSESRAGLHTRMAWVAAVAGRLADGLAHVATARRLLGPHAADRDTAPIDVVEAHLVLDVPGPGRIVAAEALARRAARVAEGARLPVVACQAWQLLGAISRSRDPREATQCLERARELAVRHGLPIEEIHALVRLGNDEALRDGRIERLQQVRAQAARTGAVTACFQAESSIALQMILRGDFESAEALLARVLESTARLQLLETTRYALLLQAVLGAHRGRRGEMESAFERLRREAGDQAQHTPRAHGLARAWCALLEENRPLALAQLALAQAAEERNPTLFQLTGRYGLYPLLRVLEGEMDREQFEAAASVPAGGLRWDRQFAQLADAVLLGRAGRSDEAADAVAAVVGTGAFYATGYHLGLRLVAQAAIADGWGTPVEWLREAEEYFHRGAVPAVARTCRALMRRAGARVTQRRRGTGEIPASLRTVGVTAREYEVLLLIAQRLGNQEIALRLYLSPRTVEKHVAALMVKTGRRNRIALSTLGGATQPG